jgi:hypothetical protein
MNTSSLLSLVQNAPKGAFTHVAWQRACKTRKGTVQTVTKRTVGVVRVGINYDNVADVQTGRENGTLPAENAGLPWGQWEVFPLSIVHKESRYFRFYFATGEDGKRSRLHVTYYVDGVETPRETVQAMGICLASEFPAEKEDAELNTFTVKEADIVEFGDWKKGE